MTAKKPRTTPVLPQDSTVRFLPDRDMHRCLTPSWAAQQKTAVYTHVQNLWASLKLSAGPFQHPHTGGFTGTSKLTADGNPCCRFIIATWHVAVTKGTNTIINPTLCCSPLSTSEKNHLQTVPSPGLDMSWKCKVTASTLNTPQSLPLRQTNPLLKGLNLWQLPRTWLR